MQRTIAVVKLIQRKTMLKEHRYVKVRNIQKGILKSSRVSTLLELGVCISVKHLVYEIINDNNDRNRSDGCTKTGIYFSSMSHHLAHEHCSFATTNYKYLQYGK